MKYLSILRYVFLGLSALIVLLWFIGVSSDVDGMMYWMYFMLAITIACALLFPLLNLVKDPKSAMRSMIGLLIVAVVFFIAYSASDTTPVVTPGNVFDNPTELKLSDTGLYTTYVVFGAAILSVLFTEIYNFFK